MQEIGGIEYENIRISREELKRRSFPFGQLPVLEWGGVQVAQSMAICRLIAREVGMAGADPVEDARIDMVVDHVVDHFTSTCTIFKDCKQYYFVALFRHSGHAEGQA